MFTLDEYIFFPRENYNTRPACHYTSVLIVCVLPLGWMCVYAVDVGKVVIWLGSVRIMVCL